jgi:solute carrier family 25 iron transporter 28/37
VLLLQVWVNYIQDILTIPGASAAVVTIPLDNVKTRLQTQTFYQDSRNSNVPSEPTIKYQDILSTMKTILREEGPKGFVKGLLPRVIAQAPSSAVSWTAYEMMKKYLNNKKH